MVVWRSDEKFNIFGIVSEDFKSNGEKIGIIYESEVRINYKWINIICYIFSLNYKFY